MLQQRSSARALNAERGRCCGERAADPCQSWHWRDRVQDTRFGDMRTQIIGVWLSSLLLAASACNDDANEPAKTSATRPLIEQVSPPLDLREPPKDATKTASGLTYKKLVASATGETAKRTD